VKSAKDLTTEDIEILNKLIEYGGDCYELPELMCCNCPINPGTICQDGFDLQRAKKLLQEYETYIVEKILLDKE